MCVDGHYRAEGDGDAALEKCTNFFSYSNERPHQSQRNATSVGHQVKERQWPKATEHDDSKFSARRSAVAALAAAFSPDWWISGVAVDPYTV